MTRQWSSKGPASDLTLTALIERLRDDAAWLASGHLPKDPDNARAIGVELCELLGRVEQLVADGPEPNEMARKDREWRNTRQPILARQTPKGA